MEDDRDHPPSQRAGVGAQQMRPPVPPYNRDLDPDNAVSPKTLEERVAEGERKFYPEGGPEDPPVDHPRS